MHSLPALNGLTIWLLLWRKKLFISIMVIIAGVIASVVAFMMPPGYKATVNIVPPNNPGGALGGMLGGMTSALKDIGLSKLGGKSESYTYLTVLESRSFKDSLIHEFKLHEEYDLPDTNMKAIRDVFKENLEVELTSEGNYNISITSKSPEKAVRMANRAVEIANDISLRLSRMEASTNREYLEKRIAITEEKIASIGDSLRKLSGKTLLFSPVDQAGAIATSLAEIKAQVMKSEVQYELLKNTVGENDPATTTQKFALDELRSKLFDAENKSGFAGNFALRDAMGVGVRYAQFYAEFEGLTKVKVFLKPMLEQAILDEHKNAPTMYILDEAVIPQKKSRPMRAVIIGGAMLGMLIIMCVSVIIVPRIRLISALSRSISIQ
ncbi:MAG: Wzz/FepE/Etk N-terminal domain-containing protein [Candidatus Kapaibacterium sp.]